MVPSEAVPAFYFCGGCQFACACESGLFFLLENVTDEETEKNNNNALTFLLSSGTSCFLPFYLRILNVNFCSNDSDLPQLAAQLSNVDKSYS